MLKELNLNKKDYYYLIIITIFSIVLTINYIIFNSNLGIYCSDVYVYLLNSLYYTGTNIRSTGTIYLSPVICFLTSIFFRMGFIDKIAIYIVTGAFAIFGNIGFYILLKRYFDETLSLTGCIIYSSLTLYLTWLANGTLDIPAVSMTIWTVLLTIIAIKDNPKFYKFAILFIILGVFTRYTVLLTLPALLVYYIFEKGFKIERDDFNEIKKGIIIGAIIVIITMGAIFIMGSGHFGASGQISNGISGAQGSQIDPAYNEDVSYYISNFANFISNSHTVIDGNPILENPTPLSWAVIGILIAGMGLWIYSNRRKLEKKDSIPVAFFLLAIVSFTHISSMITTLLVLVGIYFMGKDSNNKTEYFMLAWIFSNLIFFSYYTIKVNRYFLPIFPAIIYFVLLSIDAINEHTNLNKNIIPLILIALFIVQAFTFTFTFDETSEFKTIEDVSNYIIDNNPDYKNISIGVYNVRAYNWWLGGNLLAIESNDTETIDSSNATYYISNKILDNITNYTEIKNINDIHIYEKRV
ncbi:MAG: glycosyltransferase family 39 protein [Methanobrevibacter sp.]|uniref:glycosyltransferase family 39 protein n=1 Tax=Methanobrevibacter sp. TaxID=66852 RepID=UPI0025F2C4AA|nr:glycosyltransferase family 39 protein [Methanobrevibacter sp.]MBQ8016622.1 glycosyltransferase family 39 protein [Methanobrevibacter sp.]